jgi:hypothetical protein
VGSVSTREIRTKVPARLDRLPWSRWHWMIVIGLGTVWILDGLEVTIVGNISGQLGMPGSGLDITQAQVTGFGAAVYIAGGITELILGVKAERRSLEDIARPLTAAGRSSDQPQGRLRTAT